ncbi:MAG: hypothetical protein ACN6O7_00305 [Sphingobacterium sp.]
MLYNYNVDNQVSTGSTILLKEAIKAVYRNDNWRSNMTWSLISMQGWTCPKGNIHWIISRTSVGRFYYQLRLNIRKGLFTPLLPTPTSSLVKFDTCRKLTIVNGKPANISKKGVRYGVTIRQLAEEGFLPTPVARLTKASFKKNRNKGNLEDALFRTIGEQQPPIKLNPDFISEMMGFPFGWLQHPFKE